MHFNTVLLIIIAASSFTTTLTLGLLTGMVAFLFYIAFMLRRAMTSLSAAREHDSWSMGSDVEAVLGSGCPVCGADPMTPCVDEDGRILHRDQMHRERVLMSISMDYPCPRCLVGPDDACLDEDDDPLPMPHLERLGAFGVRADGEDVH